ESGTSGLITRAIYKDSVEAQTGIAILRSVLGELNLGALSGPPPFGLELAPVAGRTQSPIDAMLPGMLGFNILQSSLLFAAGVFASYRSTGVLRRIQATGLDPWSLVLALASATFVVSFVQTLALVIVAQLVYGLTLDLLPV